MLVDAAQVCDAGKAQLMCVCVCVCACVRACVCVCVRGEVGQQGVIELKSP